MRQDIVNKVNELSEASGSLEINVLKMYNLIFDYCKKNQIAPSKICCTLNNGVLVINGKNIERVSPLVRPFMIDSIKADYYENRILARTETYTD